jgi:hypothetical protein
VRRTCSRARSSRSSSMWPFKRRLQATTYYDPKVNAIADPAVREWVSRLVGRCDQLDRENAYVQNVCNELRERLTWTTQREGSPFAEGDRIAREIARGQQNVPLTLDKPDPAA